MDQPSPLETLRRNLARPVGENAVFDGWTSKAVESAAKSAGVDIAQARLAMPTGAAELIELYIEAVDRAVEASFTPEQLQSQRVGERIRMLLLRRLAIMEPAREAVRQALAVLAMPQNLVRSARIGWRTVDRMWRLAGDTSVDFNHYTKRATLGTVYGASLLVWLDDRSEDNHATAAFIDRRLNGIARFDEWKSGWVDSTHRPSVTRFLGRLRYPAR